MDGVTIPFLPTTLWIFATALALIIVFISFVHYLFYRKRIQAVCDDTGNAADLAARKEQLQADVDNLRQWIENKKNELERLQVERQEQERLRAELATLEQQVVTQDQKNEILRNEVGELENQRYLLTQTLERLNKEIGDIEAQREVSAALRAELLELEQKVEEAKHALSLLAGAEARIIALKAEEAAAESGIRELKASIEEYSNRLDALRSETGEAEGELNAAKEKLQSDYQKIDSLDKELEELERKRESLIKNIRYYEDKIQDLAQEKEEYEELTDELKQIRSEISSKKHILSDVAASEAKLITLNARAVELQTLIEESEQARSDASEILEELKTIKVQRRFEENIVQELRAKKAVLKEKVNELRLQRDGSSYESEQALSAYADLIETPCKCVNRETFDGVRQDNDEGAVLEQFRDVLESENIKFPTRVIDAFHTSLKCQDINPLTVLAGVSGTGKTLLPIYYAVHLGMHSHVMSVQPRWDSPQDMFGFYNYIEKQYKATDLARALILMDPYSNEREAFKNIDGEWTRDRMLLVLLDEMNLARTEYYFSDFLSKLELRRLIRNPDDPEEREKAEIELDVGPNSGMDFKFWVGQNILFVGTMNEDETTQTLSDKVLDRANVLRFGKPDTKSMEADVNDTVNNDQQKYLSFDIWKSWHKIFDQNAVWSSEVNGWLSKLNEAMDKIGRPFGYRIHQAVTSYVANYPQVNIDDRFKFAFGDQIEQKMIPKLRGLEINNHNSQECLSIIREIVSDLDDEELVTSFDQALEESEGVGLFQWRGVTRKINDDE